MLKLAAQKMSAMSKTLRVDVARLDNLMNLVGELVIDRTRLIRIANHLAEKYEDEELAKEMLEVCRHVGRITDEVQDEVMKSRMLPIDSVFSRFPRMVRDLAQSAEKQIDFIVEGGDTELDRSVSESSATPGPPASQRRRPRYGNPGTPSRRRKAGNRHRAAHRAARREPDRHRHRGRRTGHRRSQGEGQAVAQGLITQEAADRMSQADAVNLIFSAGLSTAEKVTTVSGRGVGMDIVRANIEKLNGTVAVSTELGRGRSSPSGCRSRSPSCRRYWFPCGASPTPSR